MVQPEQVPKGGVPVVDVDLVRNRFLLLCLDGPGSLAYHLPGAQANFTIPSPSSEPCRAVKGYPLRLAAATRITEYLGEHSGPPVVRISAVRQGTLVLGVTCPKRIKVVQEVWRGPERDVR